MKTIPQYCQNCRERNALGEPTCRKCGTRLMLVVFPQSLKYDTNHVPTYYEDHLLERVTSLELRLAQITERLATTLDLMLRQTKTSHTDHLLLETLIESLNALGAIEKDALTQNWRERVDSERVKESAESRRAKILTEILAQVGKSNPELFAHLVKEGIRLLSLNEEKQSFRMLERAAVLAPENFPLLMLIAENYFRTDKFEAAKIYLEKARKLSPDNEKVCLLLGVIYADEGSAAQAEKLLTPLAVKKEKAFCVHYILGMLAALETDWAAASAAFKSAANAGESAEINYLVGCVYFERKRPKIALRYLRKAVETDTNFADAWFMSSVIYRRQGDEKKSEETRKLAFQSKETGAQSLEFLKRDSSESLTAALPFLRLRHLKNRLLTGGSARLTKFFREETFQNSELKTVSKEKIIVALDVPNANRAREIIAELRGEVGAFKIGLQLFTAAGASFAREAVESGIKIFLDLKFHDIPNTVAKASVEAARLGVWMFNVHALGGAEMMRRAVAEVGETCAKENLNLPKIIAVTVLTSSNNETLREVGIEADTEAQVLKLARLAEESGLRGVVASPREIKTIRREIADKNFLIVTPGIRSLKSQISNLKSQISDDQKRAMSAGEAVCDGANYLVIGRPILKSDNPRLAAREILDDIASRIETLAAEK